MKDWKTYALAALAAWCAFLTCRLGSKPSTPPSRAPETADFTDEPPVCDRKGERRSWTASDKGGLVLDCYCKLASRGYGSMFQRCRLTFSEDGTLTGAEMLPDRVRLKASCRADDIPPTPAAPEARQAATRSSPGS